MSEREELERAIASLDGQRTALGDTAVETALAALRQKLAALDGTESTKSPLAGERRIVTILFCDVKGSTSMAEKLDPEEWAGIMKRAFAYLIDPVTRHDGIVARLMGDAILAFFGAPTAHEDDPVRAVRAGLEIIEGIRTFREEMRRERGLDFNVRVGINTGLVFVGAIGSDRRVEYTAMGDAINLAARMEQTAQPGTVQIADATYKLVEPFFEFESLGGIEVKGKDEPVPAYRVTHVKKQVTSGRGLEGHGLSSPLVGRKPELDAFTSRLRQLVNTGEGGIVGIIGEAGLGKSRLVAEAKAYASMHTPNHWWLEGHTLSFGQTISYWPFQQILRGWAGIGEEDDADAAWNKLETRVHALFSDETIDYLPYLASLLAIPVRGEYEERVKYLDGEAMGKQIFLTSRRLFERLAHDCPTVLVFEDLHWMDQSSNALLQHLLPLTKTVPLLVVDLSRSERDTPAAILRDLCASDYAERYTEIRLAPLTDAASAELVRNLLDIENLPAKLRELIQKKAEGNPFFIEEIIRTLIAAGGIVRDPTTGRWRATAQIESIHIPDTIQGVIIARVDRLDEEVKQVLRIASVIGRSFLYRILRALTDAGQRLDQDLTELEASELIHEKQHLPELEYMFKHGLAQEATYESILLARRRELHARVAGAIESLFSERLEEFYGLLAYHYAEAEAWDKAQEYLLRAADQAEQIAADAEALNLYEQAMAAYARAFGDKWDPVQRAALERKIGQALFRRGEPTLALEHLYRGLEYLGRPFPTTRLKVRQAILFESITQVGHRLLPRHFLKPATTPTIEVQEEVNIFEELGYIFSYSNVESFFLDTLRGLNFAERTGCQYGIVTGSTGLGVILDAIPDFALSEHYHRQAAALGEEIGSSNAVGLAYYGTALHEVCLGKVDLAVEHAARSADAYQEAGNLHGWGTATFLNANILTYQGDLALSLKQGANLVRFGQDGFDLQLECWGEVIQGFAKTRLGRLEEALVHLQRAIQLSSIVRDNYSGLTASGELGQCYLRKHELGQAMAPFKNGEQIGKEYQGVGDALTRLRHGQAQACLLQAERANGSEREEWLGKANRACQSALKRVNWFHPAASEAMLLKGRYEWLCRNPAAAQKWWEKSLAEAEGMGLRYDEGMIHLEMGERLGEHSHLEQAEKIFAEIGAELDLAKTRALLERKTEAMN